MLDNEIVLIGYSGHGLVVGETALMAGLSVKFYAEKQELPSNLLNLAYIGYESAVDFPHWNKPFEYILGIGSNKVRLTVAEMISGHGKIIRNVIHPSANLSEYSELGTGNFISRQVSVNAAVKIGDYNILNTGCIIEHECILGNVVHIAPGAVLAGNVSVGHGSFVGANAVVKQGVKIGNNVTIGAGAVIICDVDDNLTIVGNPGRVLI